MKTANDRIFYLSAADFTHGTCSICEQPVQIRFKDVSANFKVGSCCIAFALQADAALSKCKVMRHPHIEEATSIPNN